MRYRTYCLSCIALLILNTHIRAEEIPSASRQSARVVRTLSAPANDAMHLPTDVAVNETGDVFVADGAHDRIVRFDAEGTFGGTIEFPAEVGELRKPVGLCVDAAQRLWVADTGRARLVIVEADMSRAQTIELPPGPDGNTAEPTDVAVTPDGERTYIVDNENHRILIRHNKSGSVQTMGSRGGGLGGFSWPFMIDVDADGYACVSEAIGARLQLISPRDRWAGQIGRWGVEIGRLYRPKGVVIDRENRIYVSDSTLRVVQVFGRRGNLIGVLTDDAGEPLRFDHPMGMSFDGTGRLYVVESTANRVAVVDVDGTDDADDRKNSSDKDLRKPS